MAKIKYATSEAIFNAGYKTIKSFCEKHNIKDMSIYQWNYRNRKNNVINPKVDYILRAEKAENELKTIQNIFRKYENK